MDSTNHPGWGSREDAEGTWDEIAALVKEHDDGPDDELRLNHDGDVIIVAFCGDPFAYEATWDEERERWVPHESAALPAPAPALRIRINVYVPARGRMQWWEMGTRTFKSLCRLREKYGLDKWLYTIELVDADEATPLYAITPDTRTDAELRCRMELGLHDLKATVFGDDDE